MRDNFGTWLTDLQDVLDTIAISGNRVLRPFGSSDGAARLNDLARLKK
jgi:hypothetical protein